MELLRVACKVEDFQRMKEKGDIKYLPKTVRNKVINAIEKHKDKSLTMQLVYDVVDNQAYLVLKELNTP